MSNESVSSDSIKSITNLPGLVLNKRTNVITDKGGIKKANYAEGETPIVIPPEKFMRNIGRSVKPRLPPRQVINPRNFGNNLYTTEYSMVPSEKVYDYYDKEARKIYNNKVRKLASSKEFFDNNISKAKDPKYVGNIKDKNNNKLYYGYWRKIIYENEQDIAKRLRENEEIAEDTLNEYAIYYVIFLVKSNEALEEELTDEDNEAERKRIAIKLLENTDMPYNEYKALFKSFPIRFLKPSQRPDIQKQANQIKGIQLEKLFEEKLKLVFPTNRWKIEKLPDREIVDYKIIDTTHTYIPILIELKARYEAQGKYPEEKKEVIRTPTSIRYVSTEATKAKLEKDIEDFEKRTISNKLLEFGTYSGTFLPVKKIDEFERTNKGKNCYFVNYLMKNNKPEFVIGKYNYGWNDYPEKPGNEGEENRDIYWNEFEVMKFTPDLKDFGRLSKY